MAHINKTKMKNDIVLTIALLFSLIFVRAIMHATCLSMSDYDTPIFFIASYFCIKATYNFLNKLVDKMIMFKRNLS